MKNSLTKLLLISAAAISVAAGATLPESLR